MESQLYYDQNACATDPRPQLDPVIAKIADLAQGYGYQLAHNENMRNTNYEQHRKIEELEAERERAISKAERLQNDVDYWSKSSDFHASEAEELALKLQKIEAKQKAAKKTKTSKAKVVKKDKK